MGTYEEYIRKSNDLFSYINGRYSVKKDTVDAFKREFESMLNEVAFVGEYPVGTSLDCCSDPVSSGYQFKIEANSFSKGELNIVHKYFDGLHVQLEDTKGNDGVESYIGNLASVKSKCRFVIITKNTESIKAIDLINELFYKTPPILIMTIDSNGNSVFVHNGGKQMKDPTVRRNLSSTSAHKSDDTFDLHVTGWDNLDF